RRGLDRVSLTGCPDPGHTPRNRWPCKNAANWRVFAGAKRSDAGASSRAVLPRPDGGLMAPLSGLAGTPRRPVHRRLNATGPRLGAADAPAADSRPERALWRSRRVAYLKLMLPAIALLIVTLILAWPQIVRNDNRVRFGGGRISADEADTLRMINARYVGVDDQQRPYV